MGETGSTGTVAPGFEGYIKEMLDRSWGLSREGYQPYTGQRFAFETPEGKPGYSPWRLKPSAVSGVLGSTKQGSSTPASGRSGPFRTT